jgi:hypothetical protein
MARHGHVLSVSMYISVPTSALASNIASMLFFMSLIFSTYILTSSHVRWVSCHHGMARSQVADGGKSSGYGG